VDARISTADEPSIRLTEIWRSLVDGPVVPEFCCAFRRFQFDRIHQMAPIVDADAKGLVGVGESATCSCVNVYDDDLPTHGAYCC